MNRARFSLLAHGGMEFWNPLGDAQIERAVAFSTERRNGGTAPLPHRVLDIGSGRGSMVIRVAAALGARCGETSASMATAWTTAGASVTGIDPHSGGMALARDAERAARGDGRIAPGVSITWLERPFLADEFLTGPRADGAADAGGGTSAAARPTEREPAAAPFDAALCIGATHVCPSFDETLRAMRSLLAPGGRAVVGEGFWLREPDPEYLTFLGAARDEMHDLAGLSSAGCAAGFDVRETLVTSVADFDRYEAVYSENIERFAAAHPADPDVPEFLAHSRSWRAMHEGHGRSTLGFALVLLEGRG